MNNVCISDSSRSLIVFVGSNWSDEWIKNVHINPKIVLSLYDLLHGNCSAVRFLRVLLGLSHGHHSQADL